MRRQSHGLGDPGQRLLDAVDRCERGFVEGVVGELDAELVFKCQHHRDGGVRREPERIQIGSGIDVVRVDRQAAAIMQDVSDPRLHGVIVTPSARPPGRVSPALPQAEPRACTPVIAQQSSCPGQNRPMDHTRAVRQT